MKLRISPDQARDEPWGKKDYSTAIQANCQCIGQFPLLAFIDDFYLWPPIENDSFDKAAE